MVQAFWAVGLAVAVVCVPALAARAAEPCTAFVGARLIPVGQPEIAAGTLLIRGGTIAAVGPVDAVSIPADATRVDASGLVIMPGLVDTHSHVGGGQGGDASGPVQPDVRILDSINIHDALEREFKMEIKDRNILITDVETAYYVVGQHHDSH